jgi:phenylalanyl-tRNA synthetase beta chain
MALAHRTEASSLFEKGVDPELVAPTIIKGISLIRELCGGTPASPMYDLYPKPYRPYSVTVSHKKITSYMGTSLSARELATLLTPLGFTPKSAKDALSVRVPSFRRDISIDVDIIEELARMKGYHNIAPTLPASAPPVTLPDRVLGWEREVKTRLRDWGFTEAYTYSMISEEQMDQFGLNKKEAYKIANPLSVEWVYMRPKLWPGFLATVKQNVSIRQDLKLFELSMVYEYQKGDLPRERPALIVALTGHRFAEAKGLTEAIFALFGIPLPEGEKQSTLASHGWNDRVRLLLGDYGSVSEVNADMLARLGIAQPVTIVSLYFDELVKNARPTHVYQAIPKHPPIIEDFTFVVPGRTPVGPLLTALRGSHKLISDVALKDVFAQAHTVRVHFADPTRNITNEDVLPARAALIAAAEKRGVTLKE